MWDDGFGHWFAGFVDGEGHFDVRHTATGSCVCRFVIGLRADDLAILEECQVRTGVGSIRIQECKGGIQPQARWSVDRKADVLRLVAILDVYPLRAKKRNDYLLWRRAVLLWQSVRSRQKHDWSEMQAIAQQLRDVRAFKPEEADEWRPPQRQDPQLRLVS